MLFAQQKPQYSQYIFNNYLLNPALSGIENYTDVKLGYRQQWTGLEGAPKTMFISANWALGDDYLWANALSFEQDGTDPRSRNYEQHYTASPAHHGLGLILVNDKAARLENTTIAISYAYHIKVGGNMNLSAGVAAGANRIGIDGNALVLENPIDPALRNIVRTQIKPDLSAGLWLYGPRFFSGISCQQILPQNLSFTNTENYNDGEQVPHLFFTGGYKIYLSEEFSLVPSLMFKMVQNVPFSADVNVKLAFHDKFWLGAGYRKNDAMNIMAGFNVSHLLNLTYAFDYTASPLKQASNGSHEIVLGILLNNVYKVLCPQRMW